MEEKRIIFDLMGETTVPDIIDEVLSMNGLKESPKEFFNKSIKGIEPRKVIIRDTALALVEKKVPEKKLVELLAKHLETSHQIAEKIILEIKEKLIPYARIIDIEKEEKREEVKSIPVPKPPLPYAKKIEIKDVEDNAKKIKKDRAENKFAEEKKGPDLYREAIE